MIAAGGDEAEEEEEEEAMTACPTTAAHPPVRHATIIGVAKVDRSQQCVRNVQVVATDGLC
jgi:hypothetical protein